MSKPTWQRYIIKTISWRIVATIMLLFISLAFSQSIVLASGIALVNLIINSLLYLIHDFAWDRIQWGWITDDPLTAKADDVASAPSNVADSRISQAVTHEHSSS